MNRAEIFISYAFSIHALQLGSFKLKSGREAPYFFNIGQFHSGASARVLARYYAQLLTHHDLAFDDLALGMVLLGPPYKGIFLAPTIALILMQDYRINVGFASWRKEAKKHGERGAALGCPLEGKDVIILDDVLTSGITAEESIHYASKAGARVKAYVVAFDRQEKEEDSSRSAAQAIQESFDVPIFSIACLADLTSMLEKEKSQQSEEFLPKILDYQSKYGA